MRLFGLVPVLVLALGCSAETVKGKLTQRPSKPPAIATPDGKLIELDGDEETRGVLRDKRLAGFELEAKGHFTTPLRFQVDPIHTRAVTVFQNGKPRLVTYWCEVCSIRTYTPGLCWCCQKDTALDLRDPDAPLQ